MGYTKSLAIEDANRDEAGEAVRILENLQAELFGCERYRHAGQIREAIKLIEKFREKHSEPSAWDLK